MKIKGVLMDLDDTLYKYQPCNDFALSQTIKFLSRHYKTNYERIEKLFFDSRKEVKKFLPNNASSHSRLLYFKRLIEKIENKTNSHLTLKVEKLFWESYSKKMRLRKNAFHFLKTCKQKKIKVIIITNLTAKPQLEKILKLRIKKFVNFVITSEEAGSEKPNYKIIKLALKTAGLDKKNVVFIGDENDTITAKKTGIKFHLIEQDSDWKKANDWLSSYT